MKTQNTLHFGFSARHLILGWGVAAALLCLWPLLARAQTAVQFWVQRYDGPGNDYDEPTAVAVDGSNNVIVTGKSARTFYVTDYATIKYSSAGVPLWTNRYNGPGHSHDYARAVVVDGSNNVIVTGSSYGTDDYWHYATIKYSGAGVPLWTNRYNGPGNYHDSALAVAVDGSNNVIVTGSSFGSGGYPDYATIKYSSAGVALWTNRYNGPGNSEDEAHALAVDASNNVIVTGHSGSTNVNPLNYDYATIKYSSAGVPLWTNRYNGPGNSDDGASAVAVDASNNVIVSGYSYGEGTDNDCATIKYSSAGMPLWTNRYDGPGNSGDGVYDLAVDGSNNVIVTGSSYGNGTGSDYTTIKYSSAGVPLWTNRYSGLGDTDDSANSVAVDASNNVTVTGYSYASNYADSEYVTIQYSSAGVPLWTNRYNGPGNSYDSANAAAVDRSGSVIVTGASVGSGSSYDFATAKYGRVPSPVLAVLQQPNGPFQVRLDEVLQPGTLVIEASTNLATWVPVLTNTTPTNRLFYTDPAAGNRLWRYYRAYQFP